MGMSWSVLQLSECVETETDFCKRQTEWSKEDEKKKITKKEKG